MQELNLHLISDFTCEMLMSLSNVIGSQFEKTKINRFFWPLVRRIDQVPEIIESMRKYPGVALFSILDPEIEEMIKHHVDQIPQCGLISIMEEAITKCASLLNVPIPHLARRGFLATNDHLSRMEAVRYTINHDDGRITTDLHNADIILIGVSRTSKSPTSVALAHKGYKVANIPFISADLMPQELKNLDPQKIVGLIVDVNRLQTLRENRMSEDGVNYNTQYTDIESIMMEMQNFRRYCTSIQCKLIDATNRSVEETAAIIIKIIFGKMEPFL